MPLFQVLDQVQTAIGELILRRRELLGRPGTIVTEVTVEGEMLMSSHHTDSERALAREALALHGGPGPLRVLVGGLGLGYTAAEALRDPRVARVEVVELLEPPLRWLAEGLVPLAPDLAHEPRLSLVQADVFARLLAPPRGPAWDLVLLDVDHSPGEPLHPSHLAFYRPEGLAAARAHLAPGGVLAVWSTQEDEPFLAALRGGFARVEQRRVEWWNEMIDQEVTDLLFLAVGPCRDAR